MVRRNKIYRILSLMSRLQNGVCIRKYEEAERFHVAERTVQRDLDDIRAFLANQMVEWGDCQELRYDYICQGFKLVGKTHESQLQN